MIILPDSWGGGQRSGERCRRRAPSPPAVPSPQSRGDVVNPRTEYLLRLGDDALILGQRLGEWCGHGPVLEVDISLANLALDLIGQATLLLNEAGDGDRLAFHRDVLDFRNCLLVEQPNGDFAQTIARHLLYTTWQHMLLQRLTQSSDRFLARIRAQGGQGDRLPPRAGERVDDPSRRRDRGKRAADGRGARLVLALHPRAVRGRRRRCRRRSMPASRPIRANSRRNIARPIAAVLAEARLEAPADQRPILGGRRGHHSEHLGHLLAAMQFLPRTYPDATW